MDPSEKNGQSNGPDLTAIPPRIGRFLREEILSALSTMGQNGPHVCLIQFAAEDDLSALFFATNRDTLKFNNLSAEPRVSLLLDNRLSRDLDGKGYSLTLSGTASVLEGEEAECASSKLLAKNGNLGATVGTMDFAIIRVDIESGHLVSSDGDHTFHKFTK